MTDSDPDKKDAPGAPAEKTGEPGKGSRFRGAFVRPRSDGGYMPPRGPDLAPKGQPDPTPDTHPDVARTSYDDDENASDYGGLSAPERGPDGLYNRDYDAWRKERFRRAAEADDEDSKD